MNSNKTMLILTVICVLQTVVLITLFFNVSRLSHSVDSINQTIATQNSNNVSPSTMSEQVNETNRTSHIESVKTVYPIAQTEQVRVIIRQELTQFFNATEANASRSKPVNRVSNKYELDSVNQQLEAFIAYGSLNHGQMEKFHLQVSKLSKQDRTKALSQLAKAINNGHVQLAN